MLLRVKFYSCLELIEFIFSISQFGEMMVGTFCILLVLNELFTVSSMCQVIRNSMTVGLLKLSLSLFLVRISLSTATPPTRGHRVQYIMMNVSAGWPGHGSACWRCRPPPCYIDHRQEHSAQPGHLNQGILPPAATPAHKLLINSTRRRS